MSDFSDIQSHIRDVEGWLSDGQAAMLADRAATVPGGQAIVEIGSHHGRSTIVLASTKRPDVRFVAVDPFDDPRWGGGAESLSAFERNLSNAGVRDHVELFRGFGEDAAIAWDGQPVGLLFIDGAHDYATVRREVDLWKRHIAAGGAILFHDAFSSHGVTRALLATVGRMGDFAYRGRSRSLALFVREPQKPTRKLLGMLAAAPYFGRNVAVKVAMRFEWHGVQRALRHTGPQSPY